MSPLFLLLTLLLGLLRAGCSAPHRSSHTRNAPASTATSGAAQPSDTRPSPRDTQTRVARSRPANINLLDETYRDHRARRVLRGRASYYHDSLAGNPTATGEPYDPAAFTAASRTLPFGTIVRVTRVDTGTSVTVRINDRGPFRRRRRILDLSRAAAEQLEMIRRGVVRVRAEVLDKVD